MKEKKIDLSTETKIKEAARVVFYKKGFSATRTRDIAEEAGINLALLNYYFRSKEKLFEIIMFETFSAFVQSMAVHQRTGGAYFFDFGNQKQSSGTPRKVANQTIAKQFCFF